MFVAGSTRFNGRDQIRRSRTDRSCPFIPSRQASIDTIKTHLLIILLAHCFFQLAARDGELTDRRRREADLRRGMSEEDAGELSASSSMRARRRLHSHQRRALRGRLPQLRLRWIRLPPRQARHWTLLTYVFIDRPLGSFSFTHKSLSPITVFGNSSLTLVRFEFQTTGDGRYLQQSVRKLLMLHS